MPHDDPDTPLLIDGDSSVELSSNRTSLSFERTRMSADRTLMSIVRTSLSLISFGFTIYEAFHQLSQAGVLPEGGHAPRTMGLSLILLGVLLLIMGIASHMHFGRELNRRRDRLYAMRLLHNAVNYRATPTFIVALLLLVVGILAAIFIIMRILL